MLRRRHASFLAVAMLGALLAPPAVAASRGAPDAATRVPSALQPGRVDRASINMTATYDARATVHYDAGNMNVSSKLVAKNTSGGPVDRVELNVAPAWLGRMVLGAVRVEGLAVTPRVEGQTIIVPLGGILPVGASVRVDVAYKAWFRSTVGGSDYLFSKRNGIVSVYRWIPWISRVRAFAHNNNGDAFVTPVSPHVRATITTDRTMRLASSGRRISVDGRTQVFVAHRVRDFNFVASPYFRVLRDTAGDTTVSVFYKPGQPASTLMYWAKRALTKMEGRIGPYPYPTFNVAQSSGGYAMESPGLIWIPVTAAGYRISGMVTHEVVHQWFYGVVGNDQVYQPFADEAVTDFLTRYILDRFRSSACGWGRLDLSIYEYSASCYFEILYVQGGRFLNDLRARMGNTAFWRGLRDYYTRYSYRLGGSKQLLDVLDEHTPLDLVPRYRTRFPRYF